MAVPKKRRSKSKQRIKLANWKIPNIQLRPCPSCGELGRSHRACLKCGKYKGVTVIEISSSSET